MTSEAIDYSDGDVALRGFVAFDDGGGAGRRPGVLVCPEAFGLGANAKNRAGRLAKLGYVALAADPYGGGVVLNGAAEAMALATPLMADPDRMRARAHAGLKALAEHPRVDPDRLAAIGFCMGGTFALELARDGAPLRGVVSFHGGLQTQRPATAGAVKAKILVCTGNDDPFVPPEHVRGFIDEMAGAAVDWQVIVYGGAVHSFTNPDADGVSLPGAKYDKAADERSWTAMTAFFDELFA